MKYGIKLDGKLSQIFSGYSTRKKAFEVAEKMKRSFEVVPVEVFHLWRRFADNEKDFDFFYTEETGQNSISEAVKEAKKRRSVFSVEHDVFGRVYRYGEETFVHLQEGEKIKIDGDVYTVVESEDVVKDVKIIREEHVEHVGQALKINGEFKRFEKC